MGVESPPRKAQVANRKILTKGPHSPLLLPAPSASQKQQPRPLGEERICLDMKLWSL
jgi:hypothetical protein